MELKDQGDFSSTENIKNKSYSKDFKDQVIAVYKSGVYETIKDCAAAYNISNKTLSGWLCAYNRKAAPSAISDQQAEFDGLKKELARAKMENEILKKAAIYFANQAR
jgi:transposase